jgi:hypothetical protein
MKSKFAIIFLFICVAAATGLARPPKVIKLYPENGTADVKPGPVKIRILFDQDMTTGKSYSICGSGENFPEIIGAPQWSGKRAFVFSANLKPNHSYTFGINSPSFQNFKSVSGEPAEVLVVQFQTAGEDGKPTVTTPAVPQEDNQQAITALRNAIDDHYSYKDLKNLDWDALFTQYHENLVKADTPLAFARTAGLLLAHTKDKHIWLSVGDQTVPAYQNPVTANANFKLLPKLVPAFKKHSAYVCTGKFPDGIGYIYIDGWSHQHKEYYDQLYIALNEFADAPGLIIDIRGNGGGSEPIAQEFAGCFIDTPKVYAKHVIRDADAPGGFTPVSERRVLPNKTRPPYHGKVAVLTGPVVMSSCEAFVLMMKQVPGCVLVGEPTQGSSGNPQPYDLGNGVTVFLPCWKDMLPDGTCFEGIGIRPDILVKVRPDQITTTDPVIEAARMALTKRKI